MLPKHEAGIGQMTKESPDSPDSPLSQQEVSLHNLERGFS
jgi:hypothetical protein